MKPPTVKASRSTGVDEILRHSRVFGFLLAFLLALIGAAYLHTAWHRYLQLEMNKVINLGETVSVLLQTEHIASINIAPGDEQSGNYQIIQRNLRDMVQTNADISRVFLLSSQGESMVPLMDSALPTSPCWEDAQTIYAGVRQYAQTAYASKTTVFTDTLVTKCGRWYGTLTPILGDTDEQPFAVLGILYSNAMFNNDMFVLMIPDVTVVFSILALSLALYGVFIAKMRMKIRGKVLSRDEALFRAVFEQAPIGISIGGDDKVTYTSVDGRFSVNRMFEVILGRSKQELEQTSWQAITHPDDLPEDLAQVARFKNGEIDHYTLEKRYLRPDGSTIWANMTIGTLIGESEQGNMHLCILEDITARRNMEQALHESERSKAVLLSHLPGLAYRCKYDPAWTMLYVSDGCEGLTGYTPDCLLNNRVLSYNDLVAPEYRELLWAEWATALNQQKNFRYEYEIITKSSSRKWVLELGQFIFAQDHTIEALEGIVIDISELKMREAQVSYLNKHDYLTGLYNRGYFEQEKKNLSASENWPLSVAVCDINGVRLVNDAFGLSEGDSLIVDVARLLQQVCREGDVLSRTGGDEYTMLMPRTGEEQAAIVVDHIVRAIDHYNQTHKTHPYEVSLSIGLSTMRDGSQTIDQALANAVEHLSHRKLLNQKSSHSAILSSIMATLYARSHETEEHGKRLTRLTRLIGERMNLSQNRLDDLELLSMLHDIGKVGIDDRILNKPGKLDAEEWEQMKKHSEIGYRIALSTPELEHIAKYILYHHEQWDGMGYPLGLRGTEIPLESRILTVVDAFDAMTEDRVYRPAMPKAQALMEIARCSQTQFDPDAARILIELMQEPLPL